jgi:hypothetical protein
MAIRENPSYARQLDSRQRLVEAFTTAGEAHGFAFVQVNGADDDWAYWYADILQQPLSLILNAN